MVPLHRGLYVTRMADEEWKNGSRTLRCATFPPDFLPQIRGKRGGPQILVGTHSAVIAASRKERLISSGARSAVLEVVAGTTILIWRIPRFLLGICLVAAPSRFCVTVAAG